jgi:oligopeptide transport system permease protein
MIMKWASPAPLEQDMQYAFQSLKYVVRVMFTDGDFGFRRDGTPYLAYILGRVPFSIKINLYALLVYVPMGIVLGVLSAVYKDQVFDRVVSIFTLVFGSVPTFIVVFFLMMVFGFGLHLFPTLFMWGEWYNRYYIPVISLMLYPTSRIIRIVRGEIIEAMNTDEVLLLRAKGLNKRQIITRHLFRQSLTALFPQIMDMFLFVVLLSFIVEKTYQVPGMAKLFLDSIVASGGDGSYVQMDTLLVSIITFFYTGLTLIVSLINDVTASIIDPRITLGRRKRNPLEK